MPKGMSTFHACFRWGYIRHSCKSKEAIAGFGAPSDGRLGITGKKRVQKSSGNFSCALFRKKIEHQTVAATRTGLL